jgi:hypothetical protein
MAWENLHTNKNASLAHLGIVATHVRKIASGSQYEQYFKPATGTTDIINENATTTDTLEFVKVLVLNTLNDTKAIAKVLQAPSLQATCNNVFNFFYQNYQYKLDEIGVEQVRRPTRAWADRKTGIDCDCFTASVSSVLTNLGIEHYLKIIAINGRDNYQHIYVVVPKNNTGNDLTSKNLKENSYWVIDPVLNNFNEEAPKITKTKYLKMGIQLQQLNGLEEVAGLGNEFEGIDNELNGLDEVSMGRVFQERLKQHVCNTRKHIERNPQVVSKFYKPQVLLNHYRKLETALNGSEEHIDGVLEELSGIEHTAMHDHLHGVYDGINTHDDHMYGVMYGDIDDKMLSAVMGVGRKNKASGKQKASKKGKAGHFTKIKNARKAIKSGKFKGKLKGAIKKVGRLLKKTNPVAIAARGGFIMAMRTNFAKLAEKAYWGYQTREFAASKGINSEYYDDCVKALAKIQNVFVQKLGGNESTIKKAITNGRAAKKIAKMLKAKGMSGTTEELFGLGGLGSAAAAGASITAAMAFLAPIIKFIKGNFKGKKSGLEKNENGTESEPASENVDQEMERTTSEAQRPSNTTVQDDGSIEAADKANDEEPSDDDAGEKKKLATGAKASADGKAATGANKTNDAEPETDENGNVKPAKNNTMLYTGLGLTALAALALLAKGKKTKAVDGLGNFSAKRESKSLKEKLKKQGVKMPHGYEVKKIKTKPLQTIKI